MAEERKQKKQLRKNSRDRGKFRSTGRDHKKTGNRENSLEETFAGYEAGMKLVKSLSSQIDKVEKQIQILSEGEDNE